MACAKYSSNTPSTVKYWHVSIEYFSSTPSISADKVIYLRLTWVKNHLEKNALKVLGFSGA